MRIYHRACGQWWTGTGVGHCSGCHREFTGSAFDRHQTIHHGEVTCHDPATMVDKHGRWIFHGIEKPWGVLWALVASEAEKTRLRSLRPSTQDAISQHSGVPGRVGTP